MEKYYIRMRRLLLVVTGLLFINQAEAQCPSSITYSNTTYLPPLSSTNFYIIAGNNVKVLSSQNVGFQGGTYIALNPGFSTNTGAVFSGKIVPPNPSTLSVNINSVLASTGGTCPGGCLQYTLTANPTGAGPYSFNWGGGVTAQTVVAAPTVSSTYTVTVYDYCLQQTVAKGITLAALDAHYRGEPTFQFYNAISPNDDGISDHFMLQDSGKTEYAFNACYYEFEVRNYPLNERVHFSSGYSGGTGFKVGDVYWDAMVRNGSYRTHLRLDNCSGSHAYDDWIEISGSNYPNNGRVAVGSSLASSQDSKIDLYPNPSSGIVNFDFSAEEEKDISISVFSNLGYKVYENNYGKHTKYSTVIDLQSVSKGIYIAKIKTGDEVVFKKLIIE